MRSGFVIAAPSSGAGKTTVTLALLRALTRRGVAPRPAKSGPDYIDPAFLAAAAHATNCINLDAWAMSEEMIARLSVGDGPLIVEGAMGLFDGAPPDGEGSTASLAKALGLPVVLVVDVGRMSQSIAALVQGFAGFDPDLRIAGIILNRCGSARHERLLRTALEPLGIAVLGALPREDRITRQSRHLGLVQASELADLDAFVESAADLVERSVDIDALLSLASQGHNSLASTATAKSCRIAIAKDEAFGFLYPHWLTDWTDADITYFSPLANEAVPDTDFVFMPGGYPELHAEKLAAADRFLASLRNAAQNVEIYGECGGYMVLGEALIDAQGTSHPMAGLLSLTTSFADRKRHLGYRSLKISGGQLFGATDFKGHEFHYATTLAVEGTPLFEMQDAEGQSLGLAGLRSGRVSGSFAHIIAREDGLPLEPPKRSQSG